MRVNHSVDEFEEGESGQRILVLKDSIIGSADDGGDDQLVNPEMLEVEKRRRFQEQLRSLKSLPADSSASAFVGGRSRLLQHYDDLEDDMEGDALIIGDGGHVRAVPSKSKVVDSRKYVDIASTSTLASDYMLAGDAEDTRNLATFKKKSLKNRRVRQVKVSEPSDTGSAPLPSSVTVLRDIDDDDADLQAVLARTRRQELAKRGPLSFKAIAQEVQIEKMEERVDDVPAGGLVISDTSEFVRNLQAVSESGDDDETEMAVEEEEKGVDEVMQVDDYEIVQPLDEHEEVEKEEEREVNLTKGVAGIFQLLKSQGEFKPVDSETAQVEQTLLEKQKWLAKRQRELDQIAETGEEPSLARYELERKLKEEEDRFKNYKFSVNLDQVDEFGRVMSTKESWKKLCYKFHGRGPGFANQQKRLKRIAQEQALAKMQGGTSAVSKGLEGVQKASGKAGIVLATGSRNAVPSLSRDLIEEDFKARQASGTSTSALPAFTPIPSQIFMKRATANDFAEPTLSSSVSKARPFKPISQEPKQRKGFKPISATSSSSTSQEPAERSKIQFGILPKK